MNFTEIAKNRQSCRKYDTGRGIEEEKLAAILESARLSPSACNGQPYLVTVCRGEAAKAVAKANEPLMKKTFAPKNCQDSPAIVDAFKEGRVVVICVEELDKANFLRLFDYVMGAVHALDGKLIRADRDTVILLPYDVDEETSVDELEEDTAEAVAEDAEND